MRKLASIKIISNILPIENKDRIELAEVDGWKVIVQKDEFKVGDKCVYVEIDSILPEKSEFEFLRNKKFLIKTMKIGNVISQGVCFPISILPMKVNGKYEIEEDVTDIIGITKFEPFQDETQEVNCKFKLFIKKFKFISELFNKNQNNNFPSFLNKTDEVRIQNIPTILKAKYEWIATEKIDGQSGTFCLKKKKLLFIPIGYEYIICSRNKRLFKKNNSSYFKVSDIYKIKIQLKNMIGNNDWIAIQGECIAPNVQGNKYNVNSADLYIFNVIFPNGRLNSLSAKALCESNNLKFVPIINAKYVLPDTIDDILNYSHGKSMIGDTIREGLVFRNLQNDKSFKVVDPEFLLKYKE